MPYGEIRCDTITFTNGGVDTSITVSGLAASTTGNLTVTGTVSGTTANFVSGVFTTQISGATITGTTVAATTGTFTTVTGGTATITSGVFAAGSAAAPSISFSSDPNTGIYSPGADQVAISTNGTGRLFIDASGNVGVNASTIRAQVHIAGVGQATANLTDAGARGGMLRLSGTGASGGEGGALLFANNQSDAANSLGFAAIKGLLTDGSSNTAGDLAFATRTTSASTSLQERLRITSAGLVGIGTSSPSTTLHVAGNALFRASTLGAQATLPSESSAVSILHGTAYNGSPSASLNIGASNHDSVNNTVGFQWRITTPSTAGTGAALTFNSYSFDGTSTYSTTPRMVITSAGNVGIGTTSPGSLLSVGGGNIGLQSTGSSGERTTERLVLRSDIGSVNGLAGIGLNGAGAFGFLGEIKFYTGSADLFNTPLSERARIDSSGRLLVGTSSTYLVQGFNRSHYFAPLAGENNNQLVLSSVSTGTPGLFFTRTRGATATTYTVVQDGDNLGILEFFGADGSNYGSSGARITAQVDGTPGANDMPGRLVFSTTADGASSPTERLRITSAGLVGIGTAAPGATLHAAGVIRAGAADTSDAVVQIGSSITGNRNAYIDLVGDTTYSTYGLRIIRNNTGADASSQILHRGTGNLDLLALEAAPIVFWTSTAERARIDSSGRLLVGTSAAYAVAGFGSADIQVVNQANIASIACVSTNNNTFGAQLLLGKSRGGTTTIVQNGDTLGQIRFGGADGVDLNTAGASIAAVVDGAPGVDDLPTRLVFSTTADGASSPTERMRIRNAGNVLIGTTSAISGNSHQVDAVSSSLNDFGWFVRHPATDGAVRGLGISCPNYDGDDGYFIIGSRSGGDRFFVRTSGNVQNTNNSYGAISDLKLKQDIEFAGSQWGDIKSLLVKKFRFKDEPNSPLLLGLIAQDVEKVSPGLIEASEDIDAEGNSLGTVTKSVKYSVLYMKAVKALQEAMERIETLESEMAAVKAQLA